MGCRQVGKPTQRIDSMPTTGGSDIDTSGQVWFEKKYDDDTRRCEIRMYDDSGLHRRTHRDSVTAYECDAAFEAIVERFLSCYKNRSNTAERPLPCLENIHRADAESKAGSRNRGSQIRAKPRQEHSLKRAVADEPKSEALNRKQEPSGVTQKSAQARQRNAARAEEKKPKSEGAQKQPRKGFEERPEPALMESQALQKNPYDAPWRQNCESIGCTEGDLVRFNRENMIDRACLGRLPTVNSALRPDEKVWILRVETGTAEAPEYAYYEIRPGYVVLYGGNRGHSALIVDVDEQSLAYRDHGYVTAEDLIVHEALEDNIPVRDRPHGSSEGNVTDVVRPQGYEYLILPGSPEYRIQEIKKYSASGYYFIEGENCSEFVMNTLKKNLPEAQWKILEKGRPLVGVEPGDLKQAWFGRSTRILMSMPEK